MKSTEIQSTIEDLRASQFSDLDKQLLKDIVAVESEHIDDRAQARASVEHLVESWLSKSGGKSSA